MRNKAIEYPHPVLNEYAKDFTDSNFSINIVSHGDDGTNISLEIEHTLNCKGISQLLDSGKAKIILRVTCFRTSFRQTFDMNIDKNTLISIPKRNVTDTLDIQAIIVATSACNDYKLSEFNTNYFGNETFSLRKGDVIANEPGIKIKLSSILEKNVAGIVLVEANSTINKIKVNYASLEETDPALSNYIVISFPDDEYKTYAKLRTKKYLRKGIDRFLQSSLILPVITEAIAKLRKEEKDAEFEEEEDVEHYKGTIWADSILEALKKIGINDLASCPRSDVELANELLGNVVEDSFSNLMSKMTEWSTIRQEDEIL